MTDIFSYIFFFFFNDTATTEIYTLSLHDALPISRRGRPHARHGLRARRAPHPAGAPCKAADDALLGHGVARGGCARPHGAGQPRLGRDRAASEARGRRSEEHTSELQSRLHLVCRLLLE